MKQDCDFSKGFLGEYFKRYQAGVKFVISNPATAAVFKYSELVNYALSSLMRTMGHNKTLLRTRRARRRA